MLNRIFIANTDNFFCTLIIVFFIIFIFCNFFIIMQSSKKILSTNDRLRKFAFGNNGVDFTNDDLIKYQTLTCDFNILLYGIQSKPSFLSGQTSAYSSWLLFCPETFICQGCFAPLTALSLTDENLWSLL